MPMSDGHDKPTMREWLAQVKQIPPSDLTMSPAEAIRMERDRSKVHRAGQELLDADRIAVADWPELKQDLLDVHTPRR
jgi:hypothetical protein